MTAIISKPAQNRLDRCALARPKWAKIQITRRKHTRGTLRIDVLVADAAVRVENAQHNGQIRGNTKLLGKYRKNQVAELERDSEAMLDRIISASDTRVIEAYEKRLAKHTMKQEDLKRKLEEFEVPQRNFEEMFEPAVEILSRPWKVWENRDYRGKRTLLRMLFVQKGSYSFNSGLRAGELSFPFKVLSDVNCMNEVLVEPRGVEPLTSCMPCKRSPN